MDLMVNIAVALLFFVLGWAFRRWLHRPEPHPLPDTTSPCGVLGIDRQLDRIEQNQAKILAAVNAKNDLLADTYACVQGIRSQFNVHDRANEGYHLERYKQMQSLSVQLRDGLLTLLQALRERTTPAPAPSTPDEQEDVPCGEQDPINTFGCTRRKGHTGTHIARGGMGNIYAKWGKPLHRPRKGKKTKK